MLGRKEKGEDESEGKEDSQEEKPGLSLFCFFLVIPGFIPSGEFAFLQITGSAEVRGFHHATPISFITQ